MSEREETSLTISPAIDRAMLREERRKRREQERAAERSIHYAVLDADTLQIQRTGTCQFQDLQQQPGKGEIVIEMEARDQYADDKDAFKISAKGLTRIAAPLPPPTADDVKAACGRRIYNRYPPHAQLNAPYEGIEAEMRQWIEAMRDRCKELIATEPIPLDYDTDGRWPAPPPGEPAEEHPNG